MNQSPNRAQGAPGRGGKGWGTPSISLVGTHDATRGTKRETIKQIEHQAGASQHGHLSREPVKTV